MKNPLPVLLKVKDLRKALENVDGELLVADMAFAAGEELQVFSPKRFLLIEAADGQKFFAINNMGTHWNEQWERNNDNAKLRSYINVGDNKVIPI